MDLGFYLVEQASGEAGPWSLLIADGSDHFADLDAATARALSKQGEAEVLFFWCSDTTMNTELFCFRRGEQAWAIQYDCEDSAKRPLLSGDVPAFVGEVVQDLKQTQVESDEAGDEVDHVYDLTAMVGRRITGFEHSSDPGSVDVEPFQVLQRRS